MAPGQLGDFALVLAFAMTLLSGVAFLLTALGKRNLSDLGTKAYALQMTFATVALGYLYYLFFTHNFAIKYVFEYSSSDLPFFYLLSAFWGGQEGTYLLWLFLSTLFGFFILSRTGRYSTWGMFFHSLVHLFLLCILVFGLSPFRPLEFAATEGAGLNPLLQDPWMVIHPPVMFLAFAMAGIPFAIALAALVKRDFSQWLKITLPYVASTSLALIVANVLGGYWAYKTLGWGGYWAWDPVENTSFVPWVISIALIHGLLIERRSGALRRANLLLTASIFFLVIYGTFLTRSGVLADFSVHSLVDLGINGMLVGFLLAFLALTLAIFLISRNPDKVGAPLNYNIFSRDFMLFVGMVLFLIIGAVVLFWSSLPLITRYLTSSPAAADVATYNAFAFPLAIIVSLFLTLSPFLAGPGFKIENIKSKAIFAFGIALIVAAALYVLKALSFTVGITAFIYLGVIILYMQGWPLIRQISQALAVGMVGIIIALVLGVRSVEYLIFIGAAIAAAGSHVAIIIQYIPRRMELVGGHLCHFGFGLMLVGILASSAFSSSEQITIPREGKQSAFKYGITYHGTAGSIQETNNEILLTLEDKGTKIDARPQFFYTKRMEGMMKKPYIRKGLFYDLYLSPQDIQEMPQAGALQLRKGESAPAGDFIIRFVDYDMSAHATSGGMSVGATLEVDYKGTRETVTPRLVSNPLAAEQGGPNMIPEPVKLFSGQNYDIILERVNASEGSVTLSIPGLAESSPPDQLILDVSIKPGINLLWLGTFVIFLGMAMVVYYRFKK
ncbi:MAG: cytochrome c biogenesis protein CcsA [candidate division Zixibacteria bacterium]|nr:cytochrome c biogenesis protein CcsA [candidate division Zixibacteria bacterium]